MKENSFRKYLDTITTVLVVVIFLTVGIIYLHGRFFKQQIDPEGSTVSKDLRIADALQLEYKTHSRTLILVLDKDCVYCERSAGFYKRLLDVQPKEAVSTQLVAALPNDNWESKQYLRKEGLERLPYVSNVKLNQLKITALPTLILVDRMGAVLESWSGQLDSEREEQVLEAIKSRTAEAGKNGRALSSTFKLFDETKPVNTINFDPNLLLNIVDVDAAGYIYTQNGGQIEKRKADGTHVEQIPIPEEMKTGAACAGSDSDFHFILAQEILTSYRNGSSRAIRKTPLPRQISALSARYDAAQRNIIILSNTTSSSNLSEQILYKFNLSKGELAEIHRAQLPFVYNAAIGLGKISYAIGANRVYVSDPTDYKVHVYSLDNNSLITTFSQPFDRPPIHPKDGSFESRNIVAEDLSYGGVLKQYPAIFNLDYINSKNLLLVWTSVRNSAHEQMVDVFNSDFQPVGRDFKPTNPLFSGYRFPGDVVIAPDYGFGKQFHLDFLSPLEPAYYKMTSIKAFELLAVRH